MRQSLSTSARATVRALLALLALLGAVASAAPLRVAVISDLNGAYGSTRYQHSVVEAVAGIVALHPDLVINTGDMVAGQRLHPPLQPDAVDAMWRAFHVTVSEPLARAGIPMAVTPGNHDASAYPLFRAERAIFTREWSARRPALDYVDGAGWPFDYAFALGEVLFVSLDVTTVGRVAQAQLDWLDRLLAAQGAHYRHRVVFSHLPVYPFASGMEREVSGDERLAGLLARHHVDAYLSGHHHAFYPGWHDGILYIGQACLGAGPRRLIGSDRRASSAVTWLEFDGEDLRVSALHGPGLATQVDIGSLPREIRSARATLLREDLRPPESRRALQATTPGRSGERT